MAFLNFSESCSLVMKVHYLYPLSISISEARRSHLASVRLRLSVACSSMEDLGYRVSIGETLPPDVDVMIVSKIGADDIDRRSPRWLATISEARKRGVRVILDYTDHHLGFTSPMRNFYDLSTRMCDLCVVPSAYLGAAVSSLRSVDIVEISDALEDPILSLRPQLGAKPAVLWFGHGTNFGYLAEFLAKYDLRDSCESLTIVSSIEVINWVNKNQHLMKVGNVTATEWSIETLHKAALASDIALLPLGLKDAKKAGASSNRLITSFALGLPVITQSIASYRQYRNFYTDIDGDDFLSTLRNPIREHEKVKIAQQIVVPKYCPKKIGSLWISAVQDVVR